MVSGLEVGIKLYQFLRIFLLTFTSLVLVRARDKIPKLQVLVKDCCDWTPEVNKDHPLGSAWLLYQTSVKQLTCSLGRKWHQPNVHQQEIASDKMGEEKANTRDKGHF